MDVQIICDQNDLMSFRKIVFDQLAELARQAMSGAILTDSHPTPTSQVFTDQQNPGGISPDLAWATQTLRIAIAILCLSHPDTPRDALTHTVIGRPLAHLPSWR